MYPTLIQLGPIPIHSYGFLIAIGFLVAVGVIKRLASESKLNVDRILDLTFWSLLIGFLGSRILFIITRWNYFSVDPLAMFKIWEGGLVFLGAPPVVLAFILYYTRKHELPVWKVLDLLAPGVAIAHSFGRIGCLAAGCCYGKPTGGSFGVHLYSELVDKNLHGIPLHPTQLYESTSYFVFGITLDLPQKIF